MTKIFLVDRNAFSDSDSQINEVLFLILEHFLPALNF